jgi:hypothetical protein
VRYIRQRAPAVVTLVRMGKQAQDAARRTTSVRNSLRSAGRRAAAVTDVPERLRGADSAAMFFDPACDWAPQRDFELCTQVDASISCCAWSGARRRATEAHRGAADESDRAYVVLLTLSNVFMTFAWYAHLKHLDQKPWSWRRS